MGSFLESEKHRQAAFKVGSSFFSEAAKSDGIYKGKPRPFCLPKEHSSENLFAGIRDSSISFFVRQSIKWHEGQDCQPSVHLCDSQVCCVNFLFTFADKPEPLKELLRPIFPTIARILPIEDGRYLTFEWIGKRDYLNENKRGRSARTRGANCTSADAALLFEHDDGLRHLLLIEWKYTESYHSVSLKTSERGTDRTKIYFPLYEDSSCPLDKSRLPSFDDLFFEPFYQLMRQQFLAHEIEKENELGAHLSSVLHIAPAANADFPQVTSPKLRSIGNSVIDVWKNFVLSPNRFHSVATELFFGRLPVGKFPELGDWWTYITKRYSWVQ